MPQPLGLRVRDEVRLVGLLLTSDGLGLLSLLRGDGPGLASLLRGDASGLLLCFLLLAFCFLVFRFLATALPLVGRGRSLMADAGGVKLSVVAGTGTSNVVSLR